MVPSDDASAARVRVPDQAEMAETLRASADRAMAYVEGLDRRPVREPDADAALATFSTALPEFGDGSRATIEQLASAGAQAAVHSGGPRFFHFVIGGATPAALGADWLTSALDQNVGLWLASPLGARLEALTLAWLRDLFELPSEWGGVLTTGATMANFVGLAAARHWCAERLGVDIEESGSSGMEPIEVYTSGYIHASALKALALLGIGRSHVHRLVRDDTGRLDPGSLERRLQDRAGSPSIVVANAGDVNSGDFDPIDEMADLADEHGAWLHVDGAFGLFARLSPRSAQLAAGIERARSVISDGHKWLNVPHDCGFAFVSDPEILAKTFGMTASYFVMGDRDRPDFGFMGPESSRRARALPVWATLRAYGRSGYRAVIEGHLELAQRVARRVEAADDLELLAECKLNIVCFRLHPEGLDERELDELNRRVGDMVLEDGRVYVGTTVYAGKVAFRPAIVNWRTTAADVDLLVDVIRDLGAKARTDLGS